VSNRPAITGPELIKLLIKDGWAKDEQRTHGIALIKQLEDGSILSTIIPTKRKSLPAGTLAAILGPKQTCLGHDGLMRLLKKKK